MVRSRDRARRAALETEVALLRRTVAGLRAELASLQAATAVTAPAILRMPLVQMALADPAELATGPDVAAALAAPDRGLDTAVTEIVLEPAAAPADKLAWSVLAHLPERGLLDPRVDRDDLATPPAPDAPAATEHRRTA